MRRSALFFDRDNTLIINDGYLGDPAGVMLMPGAARAVALARVLGLIVVTISNQSGVARGLFTEADVEAVDQRMDDLLLEEDPDARIDLHVYCPYHPDASVPAYRQQSELRKPRPGMILLAAEKLGLDLVNSWVIGDAYRDIVAGKSAGCRTILFVPEDVPVSKAADASEAVQSDGVAADLVEAVELIERVMRVGQR